jgi:hypothetical protein
MILSMTICEVSDEANEKGFPETVAFSSNSPAKSSIIVAPLTPPLEVFDKAIICGGARAFETSRADTLHDRDRNSMGSRGVSGGRNIDDWTGSGLHGSGTALSMGEPVCESECVEGCVGKCWRFIEASETKAAEMSV